MRPLFASLSLLIVFLGSLPRLAAEEPEVEVVVDIFGGGGPGRFSQANITREENRVIQAVWDGTGNDEVHALMAEPEGSLLLTGNFGNSGKIFGDFPVNEAAPGGTAFVARLSANAREVLTTLRLPPDFLTARAVAFAPDGSVVVAGEKRGGDLLAARLAPDLSQVLWQSTVRGDVVASVAVAPDNTVIVCPQEHPFVTRLAADGSRTLPFGDQALFRTDGGNPDIQQKYWQDLGFAEKGHSGIRYHRGGSAGVVALPDGDFVLFTTNFLRHPGGLPDFDPMLLRFNAGGEILWVSHLLDGLPAESDHKSAMMSYDPHSGDLLLACTQHGHFTHNLITTPGSLFNVHEWLTGNIMIGWIGRVDPADGRVKAATFFFPELPGPLRGGKRTANSLFPRAPVADALGNIYLTGKTASFFSTTLHAFQTEMASGVSNGFLASFSPRLDRIRYASLINSANFDVAPQAVALGAGGPVVVANIQRKKPGEFGGTNADATNFLTSEPRTAKGFLLGYYPWANWPE